MSIVRYVVLFSGQVQGVGFRWNAQRIASEFEVAGTVQNLPDGRVKLVAEGIKQHLDSFIARIEQTTAGSIQETLIEKTPAAREFHDFRIVH